MLFKIVEEVRSKGPTNLYTTQGFERQHKIDIKQPGRRTNMKGSLEAQMTNYISLRDYTMDVYDSYWPRHLRSSSSNTVWSLQAPLLRRKMTFTSIGLTNPAFRGLIRKTRTTLHDEIPGQLGRRVGEKDLPALDSNEVSHVFLFYIICFNSIMHETNLLNQFFLKLLVYKTLTIKDKDEDGKLFQYKVRVPQSGMNACLTNWILYDNDNLLGQISLLFETLFEGKKREFAFINRWNPSNIKSLCGLPVYQPVFDSNLKIHSIVVAIERVQRTVCVFKAQKNEQKVFLNINTDHYIWSIFNHTNHFPQPTQEEASEAEVIINRLVDCGLDVEESESDNDIDGQEV